MFLLPFFSYLSSSFPFPCLYLFLFFCQITNIGTKGGREGSSWQVKKAIEGNTDSSLVVISFQWIRLSACAHICIYTHAYTHTHTHLWYTVKEEEEKWDFNLLNFCVPDSIRLIYSVLKITQGTLDKQVEYLWYLVLVSVIIIWIVQCLKTTCYSPYDTSQCI